jgi:hypothetical protein
MLPRGYRQALALCVVDGVGRAQLGDRRADELVAAVRVGLGADADHADVTALTAEPRALPSDEQLVVEAIGAAAALLADHGVVTTGELLDRLKHEGLDGDLGAAWGDVDGLTRRMWTDTAMLAGYLDPEVDRVIAAYVARAIGSDPAATPAERVIAILPLEFAILRYERS